MVKWLDPDDFAVLSGYFTGLGVCDKMVGIVTAGDENEFTLDTQEGPVAVITDEDTVWEDFGDHDFGIDDKLKVEGCWDGDVFVAKTVEYKDCCDQDTCFKLVGTATEITPDVQFTLVTEEGPVTVLITGETVMEDFDGNELADGDVVKVEGCLVGDDFVADVIELKRSVHEEKCFKMVGTANAVDPGLSFDLVTGKGTITVLITADTIMEGFDGEDIAVGDKVKVEGCMEGDEFVAHVVELKKNGKP
jgi:cytoskeletal protein CcmA (bactofilin family)